MQPSNYPCCPPSLPYASPYFTLVTHLHNINNIPFFFFFTNEGVQLFKYLTIPSHVCNPSVSQTLGYYREEFYDMAARCWQEILNPRSYGYHEALGTTKPIPCGYILFDREAENNPSPARPNGSSRAYNAG